MRHRISLRMLRKILLPAIWATPPEIALVCNYKIDALQLHNRRTGKRKLLVSRRELENFSYMAKLRPRIEKFAGEKT